MLLQNKKNVKKTSNLWLEYIEQGFHKNLYFQKTKHTKQNKTIILKILNVLDYISDTTKCKKSIKMLKY